MAGGVVISTLMVILSYSEQDMESLWETTGAVNDPNNNKHELNLALVLLEGNFRSTLIDDWANQSFVSMYVQGINKFGDVLWETEYDVTEKSSPFSSWLVGGNIINSTALLSGTQETTYSNQNYRFRVSPSGSAYTSWFAVSYTDLSYGPLPQILVPRSPDVPFSQPDFIDGLLGCWNKNDLLNTQMMFSNDSITPAYCIAACTGIASIALITVKLNCYCADTDSSSPPADNGSQCYLLCPSIQICGGFSSDYGSAYHVQGEFLPGYIETNTLFVKFYATVSSIIEVDISQISVGSSSSPAFITSVSLTAAPVDYYTILYSTSNCLNPSGDLKTLSLYAVTPSKFKGDGRLESVDILMVRCIKFQFATIIPTTVRLRLFGPAVSSEHVEASALVIKGKSIEETTTTSSTSSTTATTVPSTISSSSSSSSSSTTTTTILSSSSTTTTAAATAAATTTTTTFLSLNTSSSSMTSLETSSSSLTTSSTVSTTEISTSTATSTDNSSQVICYCPCSDLEYNLTAEQLQDRIAEIKRNLTVNVSNLSSRIRRLTSAEDSRISAVSIGYVGVGILVAIFSAIVLIDSSMLYRDMIKLLTNLRDGFCCNDTSNTPSMKC